MTASLVHLRRLDHLEVVQSVHDELFADLRAGRIPNDGDRMAKSTLMGILGRMSAYTGKQITWDEAWNSEQVLMPQTPMTWETKPPACEVAIPGITKFS